MSVKARFYVSEVTKRAGGNGAIAVTLLPVVRPSQLPGAEGNIEWSRYTPSGKIELTVTAEGATDWFETRLGTDVAITFDDVE